MIPAPPRSQVLSLQLRQLLLELLQLPQLVALMAAGLAEQGQLRDVLALLFPGSPRKVPGISGGLGHPGAGVGDGWMWDRN